MSPVAITLHHFLSIQYNTVRYDSYVEKRQYNMISVSFHYIISVNEVIVDKTDTAAQTGRSERPL